MLIASGAASRLAAQLHAHLTGPRVHQLGRALDEHRLEAAAVAISLALCIVIAYVLGA